MAKVYSKWSPKITPTGASVQRRFRSVMEYTVKTTATSVTVTIEGYIQVDHWLDNNKKLFKGYVKGTGRTTQLGDGEFDNPNNKNGSAGNIIRVPNKKVTFTWKRTGSKQTKTILTKATYHGIFAKWRNADDIIAKATITIPALATTSTNIDPGVTPPGSFAPTFTITYVNVNGVWMPGIVYIVGSDKKWHGVQLYVNNNNLWMKGGY